MDSPGPLRILLERPFRDGRLAEVVKHGPRVYARVYTASHRIYLEHEYGTMGEAITAVTYWDGQGYPLSYRQRTG